MPQPAAATKRAVNVNKPSDKQQKRTGKFGQNRNSGNDLRDTASASDIPANNEPGSLLLAASPPVAEDFVSRVSSLSATELRKQFPGEENCHRAMLERARKGRCTVHPDFRRFKDFLLHMGQPRPGPTWTVDRLNPSDPEYAPNKVRWADKREQSNNRRNTRKLRGPNGEIHPLTDWARKTGQKPGTIRRRYARGATQEEAVAGPARSRTNDRDKDRVDLKASGWPNGATPIVWDAPYERWRNVVKPQHAATKAVFFAWIVGNRIAQFHQVLAHRHPHYEDADETRQDVLTDPDFVRLTEHQPMFDEAHSAVLSDPEQTKLFQSLRRARPNCFHPEEARDAMLQTTET